MEYIAHKRDDGKIQTVAEHLFNTSNLAEEFGEKVGLGNVGKLIGKFHDIGKLCSDFTDYINGSSDYKRGDIDHSFAGAKYLIGMAERNAATMIEARAIVSHHGLHDWIDK